LIDEQSFAHEGKVDFLDNIVDRSSGTMRVRAELPNPEGAFTPGMFGRIQVPSGPPHEALLVPDAAIGTEQVRKFVLVVDDHNIARVKYVTLGQAIDRMRVVQSGLNPDDRVIVNGLMRVRPGAPVTPQVVANTALAVSNR
jgi:RND family efflux transporter MFP subunit